MSNMNFKPEEENEEQYIYRICSTKESSGMTWKEIADIINRSLNNNYTESAYRKKYQMFQNGLKACQKQVFSDDEYLKKIQEERRELEKAKKQFQDQRREYNKILARDARSEHLVEELIKVANRLDETKMLPHSGFPLVSSNNEAVLVLTDWHYGMVTDNIWNKYNTQICRERVGMLCDKTKEYLQLHKVNKLHIMLLGDFISGSIHSTVRVASEENTCEQLIHVSELLAEAISELSAPVNYVEVYCTYGNHARTVQKKEDSIHSDNMERIIGWWLDCRLLGNNKIHVWTNMPYEFIHCVVCGHNIIGVHGDLENYNKLGIDMHTLFTKQYGVDVEYVFMGDKHNNKQYDSYGIETTLVSSLCGTDDYANNKRLYSKAGQTLCIFNKEDGKVCSYNITF